MMVSSQDEKRDIIPRWRSFQKTIQLNELANMSAGKVRAVNNDTVFRKQMSDWERYKKIPYATELLSSALIMGRNKEVLDVARLVVNSDISDGAKIIARRVLGTKATYQQFSVREIELRAWIRLNRQYVEMYPRDPFAWIDLALGFSSVGEKEKAERAILVAVQLAPHDRFVLRSAARFFIHIDAHGTANEIIRRSSSFIYDPWLIAAEISTSQACGRSPKSVKQGRSILSGRSHEPYHVSELASAIGMLEYRSNKLKNAKKAFQGALLCPTENTVAQACWVMRHERSLNLSHELLKPTKSAEALSFQAYKEGRWDDSIKHSEEWRNDQPFSNKPANLATYVATVIEDDVRAEGIAREGLKSNPENSALLNNFTIALARQGKIGEAKQIFSRITVKEDDKDVVIYTATKGLLHYRERNFELGDQEYGKAIGHAKAMGNQELLIKGLIYEQRERLAAGITVDAEEIEMLEKGIKKLEMNDIDTLFDNLKNAYHERKI